MSDPVISDQIGVQLSALMDGELARDEMRFLLRRIEGDPQLAQRWSRYEFARAVLRRQVQAPLRSDFADSLSQRLAAEAVPARRRGAGLLRWVGGGAIAASVAVAALVMTRPALQNPGLTLASTPAATAIQDTRTPATAASPLPALLSFDYAQPASLESAPYSAQPYELLRRRYEPIATDGGIPYVLRSAPLLPVRAAAPPAERKADPAPAH